MSQSGTFIHKVPTIVSLSQMLEVRQVAGLYKTLLFFCCAFAHGVARQRSGHVFAPCCVRRCPTDASLRLPHVSPYIVSCDCVFIVV